MFSLVIRELLFEQSTQVRKMSIKSPSDLNGNGALLTSNSSSEVTSCQRFVDRLRNWLIDIPIDKLPLGRAVDWLIDWWMLLRSFDWLIDWLIDWVVYYVWQRSSNGSPFQFSTGGDVIGSGCFSTHSLGSDDYYDPMASLTDILTDTHQDGNQSMSMGYGPGDHVFSLPDPMNGVSSFATINDGLGGASIPQHSYW